MKAYSVDLRQKIVEAVVTDGQSQRAVAQRFAVSLPTVQRYMRLQREEADLKPKPLPGRVPRIQTDQEPLLRRLVEANPSGTLGDWAKAWQQETGHRLPLSVLHRHLHRLGYRYKKSQK